MIFLVVVGHFSVNLTNCMSVISDVKVVVSKYLT